MFGAMLAKFKDNSDIRSFLLQTGTLVGASPTDKVWGVGLPLQNPDCYIPEKWKGKNKAGKVLERVRQSLIWLKKDLLLSKAISGLDFKLMFE